MKAENGQHRLRQWLRGAVAASRRTVSQWSRRTTAAAIGITALLAAAAAAALVATGASATHPKPTVAASDAALSTNNGLHAIFKLHPDLGRPVADLIRQDKLPTPTYTGDRGRVGVPRHVHLPAESSNQDTSAARYIPGSSGSLNPLQLASLALRAGCSPSEAPIAAAIASAESGGDPGAQGDISLMDSTWDWSEGLWQIRGLRDERGTGQLRDSMANANPVTNADAMYVISNGCTNWTPWTTYNTGAYLAYLPMMKSAVSSAVGYQVKTGSFPPVTVTGGQASVPSAGGAGPQPAHKPAKHHARTGKKSRTHHRSRPHGPSSSAQPTAPAPKRRSAKPAPKPTPSSSHKKKHHLPLPTKLPTSKLPKPTLPSLPTSGLPTLPTSLLPTLPSLP